MADNARITHGIVEVVSGANPNVAARVTHTIIEVIHGLPITYDTFTEASDTELSAHTDDMGNSWTENGWNSAHISSNKVINK